MKIFVTGANGFVGSAVAERLEAEGYDVVRGVRCNPKSNQVVHGEIDSASNWQNLLDGSDVVVHAAARVHIMNDKDPDALNAYQAVNYHGTINLAKQAEANGVKIFIFISTMKVSGESGYFAATDCDRPTDPYAQSKFDAEQWLTKSFINQSGMKIIILRPPLIYGPKVGANFYRLIKLVAARVPLPIKNIDNFRSILFIGNLTDVIAKIISTKKIQAGTYFISDPKPISTSDLVNMLSELMNIKLVQFYIPLTLLKLMAKCVGKSDQVERLIGSLYCDAQKINEKLNWKHPYQTKDGLKITVDWYLGQQ